MDTFDVIERFVDRERVDADALKAALATEDGRSYLVDLLAMREMVMDQADVAPVAASASAAPKRPAIALVVAAAASAVLGVGSYQWGLHRANAQIVRTDVLTQAPSQSAPLPLNAAPAATSVIYLEPGKDWHQVGGN